MRNAYCVMFKNVKINIFELKIARKLVKVLHNNEQCDIIYKYTAILYINHVLLIQFFITKRTEKGGFNACRRKSAGSHSKELRNSAKG